MPSGDAVPSYLVYFAKRDFVRNTRGGGGGTAGGGVQISPGHGLGAKVDCGHPAS